MCKDKEKVNKMEEIKEKQSTKQFFSLLKSLEWPIGKVGLALLLSLLGTAASLAIPLFTRDLVDSLTASLFNWKTAVFLFVVFVLQAILGGVSYYLLAYLGETAVADLRNRLWEKVLRLPVIYFDHNETGETMSRITQDTLTLKDLVSNQLVSFVTGIISIVGSLIILLYLDWKMTLIMLISVPISIVLIMPLGKIMHKIAKATQGEMANFSGHLSRVLSEIRLVKAYRAERTEVKTGQTAIRSLFGYGVKEAKVQAIISPIMTLIMMSILVVILGYGGAQVSREVLSAGTLVAIIFLMFQIVVPFAQMAQFFTSFQKAVGATERIQEILHMDVEPVEGSANFAMETLRFDDVHFEYEDGKRILHSISFEAKPGTTTAFVGPSGGGKTTIFSLIERFYQPTDGRLLLGNQPFEDLSLEVLRQKIGYVSQESPLLSGTIFDNIAYGLEVRPSLEEVRQAAQSANALEFIEKMPNQFEAIVGERGMKLSGGQRQRIAIARALLHNPEILLLDEATSNLDSGSEAHVQDALERLMQGRTTFVIAHRLATITHADQIIVLENGEITGIGKHEELFKTHSLYQQFAEGQGLSI